MGRGPQEIVPKSPGKAVLALIRPSQDQGSFLGTEEKEGPRRLRQDAGVQAQAEDLSKIQAPHLQ